MTITLFVCDNENCDNAGITYRMEEEGKTPRRSGGKTVLIGTVEEPENG